MKCHLKLHIDITLHYITLKWPGICPPRRGTTCERIWTPNDSTSWQWHSKVSGGGLVQSFDGGPPSISNQNFLKHFYIQHNKSSSQLKLSHTITILTNVCDSPNRTILKCSFACLLLRKYIWFHCRPVRGTPYGPITIAIRARFEYDSSAIRARYEHDTLQHATRFFVRSHTRSIRALHENQW